MRRENQFLQESVVLAFDFAQATGDTTVKLFKAPRPMEVDRVDIISPTGLAANAANFFSCKVIKGASTVLHKWSTETGQEGDLTADTFKTMTKVASAVATDDVVALFLDETGTATLPAGRVVIHARYVD